MRKQLALVPLFLAACTMPPPEASSTNDRVLSYEQFKASLDRGPGGEWLVDGDQPVYDESRLQRFYDLYLKDYAGDVPASQQQTDGEHLGKNQSALVLAQHNAPACVNVYACESATFQNCGMRQVCACGPLPMCDFNEQACYKIGPITICPPPKITNCRVEPNFCPPLGPIFDSRWSDAEKLDLTYCVANSFGNDKPQVIETMAAATRAWERTANVRFIYKPDVDGNCLDNSAVLFDVRPEWDNHWNFSAMAFFPGDPRTVRHVRIRADRFMLQTAPLQKKALASLLTHELGHVLGFRHEHIRSADNASCAETIGVDLPDLPGDPVDPVFGLPFRTLSDYDPNSVMHYRSSRCSGAGPGANREISALDAYGARSVYGAPVMRRQIALRTLDGCYVRGTGSVTSPSASLTADSTLDVEHFGSDVFLRAQNGLYLSPQDNGTVSASCSSPGERERFHLEGTATATAVKSNWFGKQLRGLCSSSPLTMVWPSMADAYASFRMVQLDDATVALRGASNLYVQADGSTPQVTSDSIFRAERLFQVDLLDGTVALRTRDGRFLAIQGTAVNADAQTLDPASRLTVSSMAGWQNQSMRTQSGYYLNVNSNALSASSSAPVAFTRIELPTNAGRSLRGFLDRGRFWGVNGGANELRADATNDNGEGTQFAMVRLAQNRIALQAANGHYITADLNSSPALLVASSDWIGRYEQFEVDPAATTASPVSTCMKSLATGQYVALYGEVDPGKLIATRPWCAGWETFTLSDPTSIWCADEGGICTVPGTADVSYGTASKVTWRHNVTGSISCSNGTFGDPAYNEAKTCRYSTHLRLPGYTFCAKEPQFCSFAGTKQVVFGSGGAFLPPRTETNGIGCSTTAFAGDPAVDVPKACYFR